MLSPSPSCVLLSVVLAATVVGCGYPLNDYTTSAGLGDSSSDTRSDSSTFDSSDDAADNGAEACATGLTSCSGVGCVNTGTDPSHCGSCAGVCAKYGDCKASACSCPTNTIACGAIGRATCTATNDDPTACGKGTCGAACGDTQYCNDGTCTCRPGLTSCGAACVDTKGDVSHCGSCTNACSVGDECVWNSSGGLCDNGEFCQLGRTKCNGSCWALANDPNHCGTTCLDMKPCTKSQACIAGACVAYVPAVGCANVVGCDCKAFFSGGGKACPGFPGAKFPICVEGAASCPVAL